MFRSTDQETFYKTIKMHQAKLDSPLLLEGGTGLGKTRAYLKALSEFEGKVAIVLPSHQLIDQLLQSQDLGPVGISPKAFRPATFFKTQADYIASNTEAKRAHMMVCTSASVMIDQMLSGDYNGVTKRDYILFDEADSLPQDAALRQDLEISAATIASESVTVSDTRQILKLLSNNATDREVRAKAKLIEQANNSSK